MRRKKVRYSDIVPNRSEWPIIKLSRERKEFIEEVTTETYDHLVGTKNGSLREEIETTIHREKLRMKANPWRVDPSDEKVYWKNIQARLLDINPDDKDKAKELEKDLLNEIIKRYSEEIAGDFKKTAYQFAQKFVTFGFARLLNATRAKGLLSLFSKELDVDDKVHVIGETEHIRSLAKKGTVVMVKDCNAKKSRR